MNYTLWIVSPNENYGHSRCFEEVAQSLRAAFIELGYGCEITTVFPLNKERVIILGGHLLHPDDMLYLDRPVIWQLEQMPDETDAARLHTPWAHTYLEILRKAEVWDYSRVNISTLAKMGIGAKLLEVGYAPGLTRIENVQNPDIDVLFVGSMNDRRHSILKRLTDSGVKVVHAFDCYGVKRDTLVARAKAVLNVHFYESKIWEIVRCSYLMANRKCVVSEKGLDIELEKPYCGAIAFTEYDGLVDECLSILRDDNLRRQWEKAGLERMRERIQAEFLRRVL